MRPLLWGGCPHGGLPGLLVPPAWSDSSLLGSWPCLCSLRCPTTPWACLQPHPITSAAPPRPAPSLCLTGSQAPCLLGVQAGQASVLPRATSSGVATPDTQLCSPQRAPRQRTPCLRAGAAAFGAGPPGQLSKAARPPPAGAAQNNAQAGHKCTGNPGLGTPLTPGA